MDIVAIIKAFTTNSVFVGVSGAAVMGGLLYFVRRFPKMIFDRMLSLFSVSIEVTNDQTVFTWIERWLAGHPYTERARMLMLRDNSDKYGNSIAGRDPEEYGEEEDDVSPRYIFTPAPGFHIIFAGGSIVTLMRTKETKEKGAAVETITLRSFSRSRSVLRRIVEEAYTLCNSDSKGHLVVQFYQHQRWYVGARMPHRILESVVLKDGIAQIIVEDIQRFVARRKWYEERGVPWRRGYLFYGPPGCGKSSFVAALASHLRMGVATLNLSDMITEDGLAGAMRSQPKNSLLLIEDVDAAFRERQAKDTKMTFSSFLNAIDGIAAPDGRILILTTNHKDTLDAAMVRPGRVDIEVLFDLADADQAARMFDRFFPGFPPMAKKFGEVGGGLSPAAIQEILLVHSDNGLAACNAAVEARRKVA